MKCAVCGSIIAEDKEFCFHCGSMVKEPPGREKISYKPAAPASFLGGQPVCSLPGQNMLIQERPQGYAQTPPQNYPLQQAQQGYAQSYPGQIQQGYSQSYPGQIQQGYSQSYPGQMRQGYMQSNPGQMQMQIQGQPMQNQSFPETSVHSGVYPPVTTPYSPVLPVPRTGPRAGVRQRGHQMTPEEKLIRQKHEAKIRERFENPGTAWFSIIFGFVAIALVALFFIVDIMHYIGMGFGVLACIIAIIEKRRANKLAFFGFFCGIIAVLGAVAMIVLTVLYII